MTYSYYLISKWTKGEQVERSIRVQNEPIQQELSKPIQQDQSQNTFDNTNTNTTDFGYSRQPNKRDAFNEILSHRDLHTQVGQNPFLAGENYLQHLQIQENFLRPQNTNSIDPKNNG